jgi:SAM-dependent methyltransferase
VKVHVGAGDKYWPGWVNCDLHSDVDHNCDVSKLPFPGDSADELQAHHVLEHIHRRNSCETLQEWFRVLKPGGKVVIEVPCLDKIGKLIAGGEKNMRLTVLGLFGDPRDPRPGMMHQWCYSVGELTEILYGIGFVDVKEETPAFHVAQRDMRLTARKPCTSA